MASSAFFIIIFSAMMHAGWNFFTKKSAANKIAILWLGWIIAGLVSLPFSILASDLSNIDSSWIIYFIATCAVHALYLYMLGHSYSIGEMSLIYPVSRGIGILLTVIIVLFMGIDRISAHGLLGVFILVIGICLITFKKIRDLEKRKTLIAAAKVGVCVSLYSVIDKLSIKIIPPAFYMSVMFIFSALILTPVMFGKLKPQTMLVLKKYKTSSSLIGIVSFITYLLVLFALKKSPTAYVVALRETSIVFGSILGIWLLGEEKGKRKTIGIITILLGAIVIKGS